jgi:hypothetical protein
MVCCTEKSDLKAFVGKEHGESRSHGKLKHISERTGVAHLISSLGSMGTTNMVSWYAALRNQISGLVLERKMEKQREIDQTSIMRS